MQHSTRNDTFCEADEHFFATYEAAPVGAERSPVLEFDTVEAQPPSAEQLAHFTRFRRPVAWVMAAMGSLSLVALGQGLQPSSRHEAGAHPGSATAMPATTRTSQAPWSWPEFAEFAESESAIALMLEPTRPSAPSSKRPLRDDAMTQASLVNDFTSELLSMCRDAST